MLAQVWFGLSIPFFSFFQQRAAVHMGKIAQSRGHEPVNIDAKPSFATFCLESYL